MIGEITRYLPDKKFGFIKPLGSKSRDDEHFFHEDDCEFDLDKITAGLKVDFTSTSREKGMRARNVNLSAI